MAQEPFDIAVIGGGLAGGLIAWALKTERRELSVALFEKGATLGGDHTWSFHDTDLGAPERQWIAPLVSARWPRQDVRFPDHRRTLTTGYNSIFSTHFDEVLRPVLGDSVRCNAAVERLTPTSVRLPDGQEIAARAVIDCRGDIRSDRLDLGFQKFVGKECVLAEPHGLTAPIIMDATVPQEDGYRFIYILPFDGRRVHIEDTRYADGPMLARAAFDDGIADYAAAQGWKIDEIARTEEGVLPIALGGDIADVWNDGLADTTGPVARGGMRAGLFHPLTGYSLPDAVKLARLIAGAKDLSARGLYELTYGHSTRVWAERSFYRFLNRMLFRAAQPDRRYIVLQRFYKLPQGVIERLYAGVSTFADKARILVGKPPVPIPKAIRAIKDEHAI